MLELVDRITQHWVDELNNVRDNSKIVEQMVISQAAKTKEELTKLHLLGTQTMREAQRGHEVLEHLAQEIEGMMAEQRDALMERRCRVRPATTRCNGFPTMRRRDRTAYSAANRHRLECGN